MSTTLFDRILVGVDGSPEGFVALVQARRLAAPAGELHALVVCQEHLAVHAGPEAPRLADSLHTEAESAAAAARELLLGLPSATVTIAHGRAANVLLRTAGRLDATLVAVGAHSHSRAAGIFLGSVATRLVHDGAASVLVARSVADPESFPARILVGTDGSRGSDAAVDAARSLGARLETPWTALVAEGGKRLESEFLARLSPLEWDARPPADALVAAAADVDLIVVGSRGLHGLAALGSVSERVAHRAPCSVLVVRSLAAARRAAALRDVEAALR